MVVIFFMVSFQQANAESDIVLDPITCEELFGGIWMDSTCTIRENTSNDESVRIPPGAILNILTTFENHGELKVSYGGKISMNGWGTINNGQVINNGVIINDGIIDCARCGFINLNTIVNSGEMNNSHKMNNYGTFYNMAEINNTGEINNRGTRYTCLCEISGKPIMGNIPVDIC